MAHKRTSYVALRESALPPKADIGQRPETLTSRLVQRDLETGGEGEGSKPPKRMRRRIGDIVYLNLAGAPGLNAYRIVGYGEAEPTNHLGVN